MENCKNRNTTKTIKNKQNKTNKQTYIKLKACFFNKQANRTHKQEQNKQTQ